jgi:putative acetyltransferase
MNVRPAEEADIPVMAAIAAAAYRKGFAGILEPLTLVTFDGPFFARRFAEQWPSLTVADADGGVVGFAKTTGEHLDMLFVAPGRHGAGAGSALLAEAEGRGVRTLECFRDNEAARRFYERRGWALQRSYEREFAGKPRWFVFYGKD